VQYFDYFQRIQTFIVVQLIVLFVVFADILAYSSLNPVKCEKLIKLYTCTVVVYFKNNVLL
jgi:hypothetical protein